MNACKVLGAMPAASYLLISGEFLREHLQHKPNVLKFVEHLSVVPEGRKKREYYPGYNSGGCPKNRISNT